MVRPVIVAAIAIAMSLIGCSKMAFDAKMEAQHPTQEPFAPQPPVRYTGDGHGKVMFLQPDLVNLVCGSYSSFPPEAIIIGCFVRASGTIIVPNPCAWPIKNDPYAELLCHELGHAMGWRGDHPTEDQLNEQQT